MSWLRPVFRIDFMSPTEFKTSLNYACSLALCVYVKFNGTMGIAQCVAVNNLPLTCYFVLIAAMFWRMKSKDDSTNRDKKDNSQSCRIAKQSQVTTNKRKQSA